jgi:hypothetical protein
MLRGVSAGAESMSITDGGPKAYAGGGMVRAAGLEPKRTLTPDIASTMQSICTSGHIMGGNGQTEQIDNPPLCSDTASDMQRNSTVSQAKNAKSMQRPDPELAELVNAWPDLPPHIRAAVLALVDAGKGGTP